MKTNTGGRQLSVPAHSTSGGSKPVQGEKVLAKILGSQVKADLITLFHNNPGIIDTEDGIARRIGRTGDDIMFDLKDLANLGIVLRTKTETLLLVRLDSSRGPKVIKSLAKYLGDHKEG